MVKRLSLITVTTVLLITASSLTFANSPSLLKEDKTHVNSWNKFADDLYQLHLSLTQNKPVKVVSRVGGYSNYPNFYQEKKYVSQSNGKTISIVQKEVRKPNRIHVVEVFIYDKAGKLIRDYGVAYLPNGHNAPVQTLINLHGYSQGMHGYRQFDVSGDVIYEYCAGKYKGKRYLYRLFEDDLINGGKEIDKIMSSAPYKACFKSIEKSAKKYISKPH